MAALLVGLVAAGVLGGASAGAMPMDAGGPDGLPPAPPELGSITVSRIAGADRYEIAAEIAKRVSPAASNVVYVASGASFPDALSAGPAAAASFGPLLLVAPDFVPAAAAAALTRLDPLVVKVIGGTASVSQAVVDRVSSLVPRAHVTRIDGVDRYAVSRAVVDDAFTTVSGAAVATGRDFPDALSAGAVAGALGMPVLLVDGATPAADGLTTGLLRSLGVGVVTIVGGPLSVSTGVQNTILPEAWVPRISGANRYEVSLNITEFGGPDYSTVYLVTGANFPDALAGGVLAAKTSSPMFVVPTGCVPQGVLALLGKNAMKNVVLLGGTASLSPAVATLTACSF
ncbi:cell wall-binding repeat-containing protein [Herbiconiux sp. CPCC 205763]|uniref:Cell wall-binding repeat-containing protein n=1 Tax=Herbiconiux aconitum TaxID=2970913 RepID=A0ABT2GM90_9MICO|nr:cell wall-binding repeat-containing protein [Herbiconiux aconitum]MCS5717344.1 cell wall-binding repeat-containing protein [Herbiconiux aconitum]